MPNETTPNPNPNLKLTLYWEGDSGDRKRAFVAARENNGWQDLRIEVDTDDCDRQHAKAQMSEVIARCNWFNEHDPEAVRLAALKAVAQVIDAGGTAEALFLAHRILANGTPDGKPTNHQAQNTSDDARV